MPLTLKKSDYQAVMGKKNVSLEDSATHYDRMAAFKARFQPAVKCVSHTYTVQETYFSSG